MTKIRIHIVILIIFGSFVVYGCTHNFKIGGIFDTARAQEQIMFKIAVDSLDRFTNVESTSRGGRCNLTSIIREVGRYDAIETQQHVCEMLENSVIAIFGPQFRETSSIVKSICDVKEIPHIQGRYDVQQKHSTCGINLYPHPTALLKAYSDVIKKLGWSSFIIIYENNESLIRISELLRPNKNLIIEIKQLPNSDDYRCTCLNSCVEEYREGRREPLPDTTQQP